MTTRRQFIASTIVGVVGTLLVGRRAFADQPSGAYEASPTVVPPVKAASAPKDTIDWHNHWVSPGALKVLEGINYTPVSPRPIGAPSPSAPRPGSTMLQDIGARLEHLDRIGIGRQVISWATTTGWDAVLSAEQAKPLWTAFNDDLAALVRQYPLRFSGYAALTTADIEWSAGELERAYRDLGLIGAVLPVGAFQTLEGARRLTPIFDVTQKHRGIIYVHSGPAHPLIPGQTVLDSQEDDAPEIRFDLEWSATYARGITTVTQTDFLDAYPDVTVQVAMLGGLGPFLFEALTTGPKPSGSHSDAKSSLRRIYLDASTSRGPHLLELAAKAIGADRILFGSDYGAVPNIAPVVAAVQGSKLTDIEQQQIFVGNGQDLFARVARLRL